MPPVRVLVRRKVTWLAIVTSMVVLLQVLMPKHEAVVAFYNRYIFHPVQSVRNALFNWIPFSVGDILYVGAGFLLLATLLKWIYFLCRFQSRRGYLLASLLQSGVFIGVCYLIFFIGWGGNYYKPSLSQHWQLEQWDASASLKEYDAELISRLNELAPLNRDQTFREAVRGSRQAFANLTTAHPHFNGYRAKPSLFGYFMQYLGIQGYYNPFTGEAQVNSHQPSFMLPFVICHELAHQSGIASESDANLLAYAVCSIHPDPSFRYSGVFNLWLYTHARLFDVDSNAANASLSMLNPISLAGRDTLVKIRKSYRSELGKIVGSMYDTYLRLHAQAKGIKSYSAVVGQAWVWDRQREAGKIGARLSIP